jgi:hypothetical protein
MDERGQMKIKSDKSLDFQMKKKNVTSFNFTFVVFDKF